MSELFNNIKLDKQQPESQKNALIKLLYKSCQKPTIELAGRLGEKLNISPLDIGHK